MSNFGFFEDSFLGIQRTLEAETSVSNSTQYKRFYWWLGDDKKYAFWSDLVTSLFQANDKNLST